MSQFNTGFPQEHVFKNKMSVLLSFRLNTVLRKINAIKNEDLLELPKCKQLLKFSIQDLEVEHRHLAGPLTEARFALSSNLVLAEHKIREILKNL